MIENGDLRSMTAEIVSAYVTKNRVAGADLASLIQAVHRALAETGKPEVAAPEKPVPAVPLKKAVTPDFITCLFDGRQFKSIKRHLANEHGMSPAEYRETFGLPKDSPMVARNYAQTRSDLAKSMGLGMRRSGRSLAKGGEAAVPAREDSVPVTPAKQRRRPPKA